MGRGSAVIAVHLTISAPLITVILIGRAIDIVPTFRRPGKGHASRTRGISETPPTIYGWHVLCA